MMKRDFFSNKYLVFLLSFFSPMIINVGGGEVSPSFIFVCLTLPFWYNNALANQSDLSKSIQKLIISVVILQLCWLPFSEVSWEVQLKGTLVTISGLVFFQFYYWVYTKNADAIKWAVLGSFLSSFFFVNRLAEIAGEEYGMWKFQVMPRLVSLCVLIYLWIRPYKNAVKLAPFLFLFIGGLGLMTGARSTGLVPFISGVTTLILFHVNKLNLRTIKKVLLTGALLVYASYAFLYVPKVLDGSIQAGNSEQLRTTSNPYNPVNLLVIGRTDAIVPFMAFMDNPIGWGYAAKDPNLTYHKMVWKMKDSSVFSLKEIGGEYRIPGHSVWGYYSCSYGWIAFLLFLLLIVKVCNTAYESLLNRDDLLLYRIFLTISFLWNILFSPMSHFKTLPSIIAIILVLSLKSQRKQYE